MKAMIIGAAGFVGPYLIDSIVDNMHCDVVATKLPQENIGNSNAEIINLNILEPDELDAVLNSVRPDYIFHLAAQSSVALSWKRPDLTVNINIKGALNLLDAVRKLDYSPRMLFIGSGEEYGHIEDGNVPIPETSALHPGNIYAVTKACQNMMATIYANAFDMQVVLVRAFNHIGPKQLPMFVFSDFCKQVAMIEKGQQEPVMKVGNLTAKRDFTDVRDVVRAYTLLMQFGKAGETYNVGSGHAVAIESILEKIVSHSTAKIKIEIDPAKLRPVDVPIIEADITKLYNDTGWKPQIDIEQTITETLDYWRNQI